MIKEQERVLLALGWYDYRFHQGIEKYAQELGWHLSPGFTREKVIPCRTCGRELQRMRMDRTKKFLADITLKVQAIATGCGHQGINSFCISFERATGMSPRVFVIR
jgi:AraC-like DNA-binding protein